MVIINFPAEVEVGIQEYALSKSLTADQAVVELIKNGLGKTSKKKKLQPITDEEIQNLKSMSPSFGLLSDIPDDHMR